MAEPDWLIALQAASYVIGALTFCATLTILFLGGFRFGATAYVDDNGTVAVELVNTGRLAGYIAECHLVRRRRWRRRRRRYEQVASAEELGASSSALLVPAAGSYRLTFSVNVAADSRGRARVLLRFGPYRQRVLRLTRIRGVLVSN